MAGKVGEIANQAFVSLDENALVADAAKALYERDECSVIVTGKDASTGARIPVGIITERDIIFRVVAQNKGPFKVKLRDVMSHPLVVIPDDAPTQSALTMMKRRDINRLPVVDKKGRLIGLVTIKALARIPPTGKVSQSA